MISRMTRAAQRLLFHSGTVSEITAIHPGMRQIRLTDASLRNLSWQPGQHVRLSIAPKGLLLRTYTVRHYNPEQGSLDVWVMLHGEGPGARWAGSVQPGEVVSFLGPTGSFVLPQQAAAFYLFAGEETAAVTFQTMLEALPDSATVLGSLETRQPGEEVPGTSPHQLPWVYRHAASAQESPVLLAAIQALQFPASTGVAYLAGEARTCQAIRRYLLDELHWPRTAIHTKAYWTPGKTGMD